MLVSNFKDTSPTRTLLCIRCYLCKFTFLWNNFTVSDILSYKNKIHAGKETCKHYACLRLFQRRQTMHSGEMAGASQSKPLPKGCRATCRTEMLKTDESWGEKYLYLRCICPIQAVICRFTTKQANRSTEISFIN